MPSIRRMPTCSSMHSGLFEEDHSLDVAVLWGEGGAFSAGADLKSLTSRGVFAPENRHTHGSLEYPEDGSAPPGGPLGKTSFFTSKMKECVHAIHTIF